MSDQITLNVKKREATGKGAMRKLRAEGLVPGVYYAKGQNVMIQVEPLPLNKAFAKAGTSQLVYLQIEGGDTHPALIKELIRHPYKAQITHVDFFGVNLKKAVRVRVPVETVGKAKGETLGGKLVVYRDGIEVECLPTDIPDKIVLDISGLDMGDNIHIEDVKIPGEVQVLYDENFAVLGLVAPTSADEEGGEDEGEEAEAAEAEAGDEE